MSSKKDYLIDFKATTIWKAFILNAIAIGLSTGITLAVKYKLDQVKALRRKIWIKVIVAIAVAGAIAFLSFTILHFIFGFGGGMIASS